MMNTNKNRASRILIFFLLGWILAACASYPNDPRSPETGDDTYTIEEDGFLSVSVEDGILVNDSAREGERAILLTVGEQETDNHGRVVLGELGDFTYTPAEDYFGTDQLTYTIENEKGKQTDGIIYINVTPVSEPPKPMDDTLPYPISEPKILSVLDNDKDPDGDGIQLVAVGTPDNGTATANGDGTILYTPRDGHTGTARFSYTVSDSTGSEAQAWVSLRIIDRYNSIEMGPDTMIVTEDTSGTIAASNLTANDHDLYEGPVSVIEIGQATNGIAEFDGTDITYTPNPDFSGEDVFTYTVQSQQGYTASSTVTVTVTPVNDPPTISTIEDQSVMAGRQSRPIEFTIEDPDNQLDQLSLEAQVVNANPPDLITADDITFGGSGENRTIQITTRADIIGSATISIIVSDGEASSTESFMLMVLRSASPLTALHRYYNATNGDNFYTINRSDEVYAFFGYAYQNVEGYVYSGPEEGSSAFHRYYNSNTGDHYYTVNRSDEMLSLYGYSFENVECYLFTYQESNTIALYQYYNALTGDHLYTTNWDELSGGNENYTYEGIAGYVYATRWGNSGF